MSFDAIGIVEAAYDLGGEDAAWLTSIATRIRPMLGSRHGVVGVLADGRSMLPSEAKLLAVCAIDVGGPAPAGVQYMNSFAASSRERAEQLLAPGPVASLSQRLGPFLEEVRPDLVRLGIDDSLVILAGDAWGRMCCFAGFRRDAARLPRHHRAILEHVSAHVAAATRLREAGPVSADDPRCEAVLSSSGKIHDARGPARSQSSLDVLRRAAINHEKARGALRKRDPEEALSLWHGLVAGRWSLVDSFESDGRRFLVARENSPRLARRLALTPTELRVVQLVAVGHANKLVAYELGLSTCSVAMHLRRAMAKLGLQHRSDLSRVVMRALDAEAGS